MNKDYKICNCNEVVVFNENEEFKLCPICKALVINMNKTQIIKFDLLKDDTETEEEHVKNDEKINILNQFAEKLINNSKDIDPEINEIVNKNWKDLLY